MKKFLIIFINIFFIIYFSYFIVKKESINKNIYYINYDMDFFKNLFKENKNNINKLINANRTKIENIFILIGIMPYLSNNKILLRKNILKINQFLEIKNNKYRLNKYDINFNNTTIVKDLLYYKWEIIPNNNLIKNLRYVINQYYNEYCLEIFDKSLNLNFKYYINNNINKLSLENIKDLMSKLKYFSFFYRKFRYL